MAQNLPWSLRGVDPTVREAVKAAARKAGLTVAEWLEQASREDERQRAARAELEDDDREDLGGRLGRLSRSSSDAALGRATGAISERDLEALVGHAARLEARARQSETKTTNALESIVAWIEKAEGRMARQERAAAERQEMTASVIADAIKAVSSRVTDVERRSQEHGMAQPVHAQAGAGSQRPSLRSAGLSRETFAAAVSDIRSRQRDLDSGRVQTRRGEEPMGAVLPFGERRIGDRRAEVTPLMNTLRADLAQLRAEIAGLNGQSSGDRLEESIRDLARKLDQREAAPSLDEISRPLARIEAEIARLQNDGSGDRFNRLERELRTMGDRIVQLAAAAQEPRLLSAAMNELAGLKDALARSSLAPRIEEMSDRIAALAGSLGAVRDSGRTDFESALHDMREALGREAREMNGVSQSLLQRIAQQLDTVAGAVAGIPVGAMNEDDRAEIAGLSRKLDQLALRAEPESGELARKIEALAIRLDDLSEGGSREVISRIEKLSDQVESLAARGPASLERQLDAISARIETLAKSQRLEAVTGGGTFVDLSPIETMIGDLARRMDEAARPDANAAQLQALERQIQRLTERLDERPDPAPAQDGLERTLQDLMRSLGGLREETTSAVDRAARAAAESVAESVAGRQGPPAAGPEVEENFAVLRQDLAGLRDINRSIDQRTHQALGAVTETLETIMRRIGQIEAEMARDGALDEPVRPRPARFQIDPAPVEQPAEPVRPARRETPPEMTQAPLLLDQPAPQPRAARAASPAASVSADLSDMPLEPGSGRPSSRPEPAPAAAALNPNLIAAARRAAQAASAEAAALKGEDKKGGKSARSGLSLPMSLKEVIEKRRKPILLGLAAIVLALGAGQVATTLFDDKPTPVAERLDGAQAPQAGPAAQRAPTPEAAAPNEQQSALPAPAARPPQGQGALEQSPANVTGSVRPAPEAASEPQRAAPAQPDIAALPPPAASGAGPQPVLPGRVTDVGDLPAGLGTPGMRRAAQEGDPNAVFELASRAADGVGVQRDPRLALRLFERAAAAGFAPAQFRVGNIYEKGIGAGRDARMAMAWYRRAAEKGNAKAMHNLAVLMAEGADGRPDFAGAAELFRKAADFGVRDSQYNLAILLGRGLGLEQDLAQSYVWFAVAASQGDADAGKKRDEVGAKLAPADLAAARSTAQQWKPRAPDPVANDATAPAGGWDPQPRQNNRALPPKPRSS